MMKHYIFLLLIALLPWQMQAQSGAGDRFNLQNVQMNADMESGKMSVSMLLYHKYNNLKTNNWIKVEPKLTNGYDTLALEPIFFYGRSAYYNYVRNNKRSSRSMRFMADKAPDSVSYFTEIPFESWMDTATLIISENSEWCCHYEAQQKTYKIYTRETTLKIEYEPQFIYVSPEAEVVKSRSISASAYVKFPAGKTNVDPAYSNNREELGKIMATVDSVRSDRDITVNLLFLKGYASPEGSYDRNVELSRARTESVKNYILGLAPQLYGVIKTESVPENWDDLRKFVENSNITRKSEILYVINSSREPDNKEWVLKSRYKPEYKYLLEVCYPLLRRTDYTISYTIRSYSEPAEIIDIMFSAPQKLSLNEFYLAAQSMEPGSTQFNEAFEIAVRMFPNDAVANLNAANAAMAKGDLSLAKRYLDKSGNSTEATYARGVWYALSEDYAAAQEHFASTANSIHQAKEALAVVEYLMK